MKPLYFFFALSCSLALLSEAAFAASVRTEVSQRKVAVGQPFTVTLITDLENGEQRAIQPRLSLPDSFRTQAPIVSSRRSFSFGTNGAQSNRSTSAKWQVVPEKIGTFTIGPSKVNVDGVEFKGERLSILVVKQGALPSPQGRSPFGARGFDPWDVLQRNRGASKPQLPSAGPALQMEKPLHPVAFLKVIPEKTELIVGEPMKVGLYLYGSQGAFPSPTSSSMPALTQFKSYPTVTSALEQSPRQVLIGKTVFRVQKIQEWVVVPLIEGSLQLGDAYISLPRTRQFGSRITSYGLDARAANQVVQVRPAPAQNRPTNFQSGAVGRFKLSAQVNPRQVHLNDYVEVRFKLRGRGNLPSQLIPPEIPGIIWNQPTNTGELQIKNGQLVGERFISFTAQATKEGTLNLGSVNVSFYDSVRASYGISQADLGAIKVLGPRQAGGKSQGNTVLKPAAQEEELSADEDDLLQQVSPRTQLLSQTTHSNGTSFAPWFNLLPPLVVLFILSLAKAWLLLNKRQKKQRTVTARQHLSEAQRLAGAEDETERLRSLEQALWSDAENKTAKALKVLSDQERRLAFNYQPQNATYIQLFEELLEQLRARSYGNSSQSIELMLKNAEVLLDTSYSRTA